MILRSTPASPFARKVLIAMSVLGLADKIDVRETDLNDPGRFDPRAESARENSGAGARRRHRLLRLARDPGSSRSPRRRRPHHSARADGALRGAAAAGAVRRHPRCRRCCRSTRTATGPPTRKCKPGSIARPTRSRAAWRRWRPRRRRSTPVPDVGQIALACVLGYCDLRFGGNWRKDHPRLVAWHDKFAAQVPAFAATKVAA